MGLLLPGESLGIAERVRNGDPTVGWRGDPEMDVYVRAGICQVWQFDRTGRRWCAVQVPTSEPGWQHTVLRRLRDGDWQNPDTIKNILREYDRNERRIAAEQAEACGRGADKVAYTMRRTMGQHYGGLTRDIFPVS